MPLVDLLSLLDTCGWSRYVTFLALTAAKKEAVGAWKQEQVRARRQSSAEVLLSDILGADDPAAAEGAVVGAGDGAAVGAAAPSAEEAEAAAAEAAEQQLRAEQERRAAKERIAKWKADRNELMNRRKVSLCIGSE